MYKFQIKKIKLIMKLHTKNNDVILIILTSQSTHQLCLSPVQVLLAVLLLRT